MVEIFEQIAKVSFFMTISVACICASIFLIGWVAFAARCLIEEIKKEEKD